MRIAILTNEYPPNVYGGAGVHVEYLTQELTRLDSGHCSVEVVCFGDQKIEVGNLTIVKTRTSTSQPSPALLRWLEGLRFWAS